VRNAIDHGIELPADRAAAGKPARGTVAIRGVAHGERLVLQIADDGPGVSMDEVRARAIDFGLIGPDDPADADGWGDIVCHPGFTTRDHASDVSGRGVGLDAVRMGIHEVGGTLNAETSLGKGTTWKIEIPLPRVSVDTHMFRLPNVAFPIVIET